jgi:DNA-3-methyladenine glycosylase
MGRPVDRELLTRSSAVVGPWLLNKLLIRDDGRAIRIVEVEAYGGSEDGASHARNGLTARCGEMFGPAGHAYVYFTYGMHWCCNVVTGPDGVGQAVLIRAGEPVGGLVEMQACRTRARREVDLTNGPAKLCEALSVDGTFDGMDLCVESSPLVLADDDTAPPGSPACSGRVGITRAVEWPWRWFVADNPFVSRPPG